MDRIKYSENLLKLLKVLNGRDAIYIDFIQKTEDNETNIITHYRIANNMWEIRHYYSATDDKMCPFCGRHSKKKCNCAIPTRVTSRELFIGLSEIIGYVYEDNSFNTHTIRITNNNITETKLW